MKSYPRDSSGPYSKVAEEVAPQDIQVADKLIKPLSTVENLKLTEEDTVIIQKDPSTPI